MTRQSLTVRQPSKPICRPRIVTLCDVNVTVSFRYFPTAKAGEPADQKHMVEATPRCPSTAVLEHFPSSTHPTPHSTKYLSWPTTSHHTASPSTTPVRTIPEPSQGPRLTLHSIFGVSWTAHRRIHYPPRFPRPTRPENPQGE